MKYLFIPVALMLSASSLMGQSATIGQRGPDKDGAALALNTFRAPVIKDQPAMHNLPMAAPRGSGGAGEGVPFISFYESLDLGLISGQSKFGSYSVKGSGLKYQIEIGAKVPLVLMEYNQFIITGSVFFEGMNTKKVLTDTGGSKHDIKIYTGGVPLNLTMIHMNKSGGVLGYYYELGGKRQLCF